MSFDIKKLEFARERIDVVEIDLDFCSLQFGISPCTASGSGDDKCFNTLETTQDATNYTGGQGGLVFGIRIDVNNAADTFTRFDGGSFIADGLASGDDVTTLGFLNSENNGTFEIDSLTATVLTVEPSAGVVDETLTFTGSLSTKKVKTYRFCTQRSPHPIGINAIPSIKSVSVSPAVLDLKGGLGIRSSVSVTFIDHTGNDKNVIDKVDGSGSVDIDPYLSGRTYIASERGSYWTKLRARNPNYQFRDMRVLSGYLNEDGSFDSTNFQTRHYVIDKLDVSNGMAKLTGKDPLKLAMNKKAQVPAPSTGLLSGNITNVSLAAALTPTGVGDLEYPSAGKILINKEVISFTRLSDALTLVRGANNTIATPHDADDTVQLCYEMNGDPDGRVDEIVKDLLINYSGINSSFINSAEWADETDNNLSYLLDGIIVKPMDVNKVLKELSQAAPHYLWWDERGRKIQFTALKAPPESANVLDMDSNIIKLSTTDKPDMRVSTVFVNFGQVNPVENLDDVGNYQQSYVRVDTASIANYKSNRIESINSRWLNVNNFSGAKKLAELIGRRFANIPRSINFSLDAKDSDGDSGLWIGKSASINHRDIVDFTGLPQDTVIQITSAKESNNYDFTSLEFNYGDFLTGFDEVDGSEVIHFRLKELNVNLYDRFVSVYGTPDASTVALFVVEVGAVIGSSDIAVPSMEMGDWSAIPSGFTIEIQIQSGCFIVGKGGLGGDQGSGASNAGDGGIALNITENCTISNHGVIGGGGGGAAGGDEDENSLPAGGGGGAGSEAGLGGSDSGGAGTVSSGGIGATFGFPVGGIGGALGQDGQDVNGNNGGSAGTAIDENANTVTYSTAGDIRGAII